jgi:hypothetical protein
MTSLTLHGIDDLPTATRLECHPCPRTGVTYVYGLYSLSSKGLGKVVTAIARELVGFIWAIARMVEPVRT